MFKSCSPYQSVKNLFTYYAKHFATHTVRSLQALALLSLLILIQAPVTLRAMEFENVTFGFNGKYKAATWAPLDITVRSQNEPFVGELRVEVRNAFSDALLQTHAAPFHRRRRQLYVYCPKVAAKLVVQLVHAENPTKRHPTTPPKTVLAKTQIIPSTPIARQDYFVLALAPNGDRLQQFIDKQQIDGTGAQIHVDYLPNARTMPTQWIGYNAVDTIVIRETALTERNISKQQQTALLDWVQNGGTLILSGGSNFRYLQKSFIEPFLPVRLNGVETVAEWQDRYLSLSSRTEKITFYLPPTGLNKHFLNAKSLDEQSDLGAIQKIRFQPNVGCQVVMGTAEDIYIAKRNFGSGQILCLAFDYNAPPFSAQKTAEVFWNQLLKTAGKSPRHFADRYALHREHEQKIYEQFLLKMPTQVPLIKQLAIVLPAYLLSLGGILFYLGRPQRRARRYWIAGGLFGLLSIGAIGIAQTILPNSIAADSFSILSIYPERHRAHLQRYIAIRATRHTETSIAFDKPVLITPLTAASNEAFIQSSTSQLRQVALEPWHPRTYIIETFFTPQSLPTELENAYQLTKTQKQIPALQGLFGIQKQFARILQKEGVLQYLTNQEAPVSIGWTSQPFGDIYANGHVRQTDETLVLSYISAQ